MNKIDEAKEILKAFGLPNAQQGDRSALCLLALADIKPIDQWSSAGQRLIGVTPIMEYVSINYSRIYKPNSKESFRRQTLHQFENAAIVEKNPDSLGRSTNSGLTVYRLTKEALSVIAAYGSNSFDRRLTKFISQQGTLSLKYSRQRDFQRVEVLAQDGQIIRLSPGNHNELIKAIIQEFSPRFVPGSMVLYVGDTASKRSFLDSKAFENLGIPLDEHGKFPDVVLHYPSKDWVVLIESVTSHGPIDPLRRQHLVELFHSVKEKLVFVTAFLTKAHMKKYLSEIAWETEAWVAEAPDHLIHFNGERFLGPYE